MAAQHVRLSLLMALAWCAACRPCSGVSPTQPPGPDSEVADASITVDAPLSTAPLSTDASSTTTLGPGFPATGPWASFYGEAEKMGDLSKVAETFRVLDVDADPQDDGEGNFTNAELAVLRGGGKNRVLSYLNLGSCETFRTYWSKAPSPLKPCKQLKQLGSYEGYPDEIWMDLGDPDYQALIVEHVAARIAARKVDGFYLDNLELVEHTPRDKNGPCSASCRQGGLDLVRKLRERYPDLLLVMQNATSDVTRTGITGDKPFPSMLDGIAHEEVFAPEPDGTAEKELLAWQAMGLKSASGRPFWIAALDYVGSCKNKDKADQAFTKSQSRGFSHYASDASGGQKTICYWRR